MSFFTAGLTLAFAAWCAMQGEYTYAATAIIAAGLCVWDGLLNGGRE
jgi:hypothetical protein